MMAGMRLDFTPRQQGRRGRRITLALPIVLLSPPPPRLQRLHLMAMVIMKATLAMPMTAVTTTTTGRVMRMWRYQPLCQPPMQCATITRSRRPAALVAAMPA